MQIIRFWASWESAGINRHGGGDGRALRRRASDPRNHSDRGAGAVQEVEGNISGGATREPLAGRARSENQGVCGTSVRENRESPCPPVPPGQRAGRPGNAEAVSLG